jgi:hypothetical protein
MRFNITVLLFSTITSLVCGECYIEYVIKTDAKPLFYLVLIVVIAQISPTNVYVTVVVSKRDREVIVELTSSIYI